jgi:hypothetical protein
LMVLILLFSEKISGGSYFSEKDQWAGTFASDLCEYSEKKSLESLIWL